MKKSNFSENTARETFLMTLLNKITKEYKLLLERIHRTKPYKIVEMIEISSIPGESKFAIQVANKNFIVQLSAAEIINHQYNLADFNDYHAEIIRKAAQGKLVEFLNFSEKEPAYKIITKKLNQETKEFIFTIETREQVRFNRTAAELSRDKNLLRNMSIHDIYDIGFTQGSESVLKEKAALLLARHK